MMDKLNEVVRYDLTEEVANGVIDITPVPEHMEGNFVTYADYAAMQQRAEAAEALARELQHKYDNRAPTEWAYNQVCSALDKHRGRAEAAEAQLAELAKQEPDFYAVYDAKGNLNSHCGSIHLARRLAKDIGGTFDGLFTRPAPAADLAELVEDEATLTAGFNALVDCLEDCGDAEQGLRLALRAIMSRIEGLK